MSELPFTLRPQTEADQPAIDRLNARAFGPGRFARSAYRLREEVPADPALSYVALVGTLLVGANQMTPILIGTTAALLLGPLAVDPAFQKGGIGEALALKSMAAARATGHTLVVLVGDLPYYARLGFKVVPDGRIEFVGPVDPARLLYSELVTGAFKDVSGKIRRSL